MFSVCGDTGRSFREIKISVELYSCFYTIFDLPSRKNPFPGLCVCSISFFPGVHSCIFKKDELTLSYSERNILSEATVHVSTEVIKH